MKRGDEERLEALGKIADWFAKQPLTDEEYEAAREWISAEKDRIPLPAKNGILKLINNEMKSRA
jgi:hypothetical protein